MTSTSQPSTEPSSVSKVSLAMLSSSISTCIKLLRQKAPVLDGYSHKGQAGKIAVIGGSLEYTGAPFFAAMATMRGGAELAFVYCEQSAAHPIKTYSPDLIVFPGYNFLGEKCQALDRVNAIILGPGLGRSDECEQIVENVLMHAREYKKPVVIDADALWFLCKCARLREIIRDGEKPWTVFVTPNRVEMQRLKDALKAADAKAAATWFRGRAVLVEKGQVDRVIGEACEVDVGNSGSLKRVGGQGDLLAGLTALCATWILTRGGEMNSEMRKMQHVAPAVCACLITRAAAHNAFLRWGRSLLTSDILPYVGGVVDQVLERGQQVLEQGQNEKNDDSP